MRRALVRQNVLLFLSAFMILAIGAVFTLYQLQRQNQRNFMHVVLAEVMRAHENYQDTDSQFVIDYQLDNNRRITILDANGNVIADTSQEDIGVNKSNRPELQNLDTVYARQSETLELEMLYVATLLDNGNYLRVAVPLEPQVAAYQRLVMYMILISLVTVIIYYFSLVAINKNLLKPWQQVKKGVEALNKGSYQAITPGPYEEINEITKDLDDIHFAIFKHVRETEAYKEQLNRILNDMQQGVLLFNKQNELIYYNDDAKTLFDLTEDSIGKKSFYKIRHLALQEAIEQVNQKRETMQLDLIIGLKVIAVKIVYLFEQQTEDHEAALLVLLQDVSNERRVEQVKRDFFAHASHELKSPLTAIKGYAELIEHDMIDQKEKQKIAIEIGKQAQSMSLLIEDMLMLARLESLSDQKVDLVQAESILEEVLNDLKPQVEEKTMTLHVNFSSVQIMCDPLDLHKLFRNLIENAIKYSEPQRSIYIDLQEENNQLLFDVKDEGVGIGIEHQQRIFERFYRVDKGRLDAGTGLGLAIVKHIVLKYNGTIKLESSLNRGSKFSVSIETKM